VGLSAGTGSAVAPGTDHVRQAPTSAAAAAASFALSGEGSSNSTLRSSTLPRRASVGAHWADDLDTVVGGDARALDGAQAQQLALARVVLADPHTVILDEATALLDPATARHTEQALAAVLAGRTVVAIAHRLQTAHDADRVAVMDAGVVTELGTHEQLVAAGGTYAALWHSWHAAAPGG
jgi:ABC-type multidrug transport system fused ATPase/permease subunit